MYRAVTLAALEQGIDLADDAALERVAAAIQINLVGDRVLLDGRDVTTAVRTFEITTATRFAADHPGVRRRLVELQRQAAEGGDVVAEGRDQASVVFPHAECKIFLTASEEVRAQRRYADLHARGQAVTFDQVLANQRLRDERDRSRPVGALVKTSDAVEVDTDDMTPEEVVRQLEEIVRNRSS
jgi:cytidylate kinase